MNRTARRRTAVAGVLSVAMLTSTLLAGPASASGSGNDNRGKGRETTFEVTITNISDNFALSGSGAFTTPDGGDAPGPVFPGSSYSFDVYGNPGDRLSLATMLVQSNDWFFSPLESGISLFDADDKPISGNVTDEFYILDAGTEIDQTPGKGADQAPRQSGPNTGASDPDDRVRVVDWPNVSELIEVMVEAGENGRFTITVSNVSGSSTLPGPIAPGVFAVHTAPAPIFSLGQPDRGEGLEGLAEDGAAGGLAEVLAGRTGVATPLAPGVYASNRGHRNPLFRIDRPDRGNGLEALAEDGDPGQLAEHLAAVVKGDSGAFTTPLTSKTPAPLSPGDSYRFEITSKPGETVSVASMFVQSNDWFFSTNEWGLNLFRRGRPLNGNITHNFALFDSGTEIDQEPGFGSDQAPRQTGPNVGTDDPDHTVRLVQRDVSQYIRVSVRPIG